MQKVYITTYALTSGIIIANIPADKTTFFVDMRCHQIGKDAFYTIEEAMQKAEEMRTRRIGFYRREISRLKNKSIVINDIRGEEDYNT